MWLISVIMLLERVQVPGWMKVVMPIVTTELSSVVQMEEITNITLFVGALFWIWKFLFPSVLCCSSSRARYGVTLFFDPKPVCSFFQTDEWRLSCINKEFSVCPSYPPVVIVPKSIDDEALRKVAMFRHGSRFPVLSYYHKKNGMVSRVWVMVVPEGSVLNCLNEKTNLCSRLNAVCETFAPFIFQLIKCMQWNWFRVMEWVISILEIPINPLVWERTWHELAHSSKSKMRLVKPPLAPLLALSAKRLHAERMAESTLSCLWVVGCLLRNGVMMTASVPRASTASAV